MFVLVLLKCIFCETIYTVNPGLFGCFCAVCGNARNGNWHVASRNADFSFSLRSWSNTCIGNKTHSYSLWMCTRWGAKTNKSCLFSLNEKGKETRLGFVHNAVFVLEQRRIFLSSSVFVSRVADLQWCWDNVRYASCIEAWVFPAFPAHWSVTSGPAKKRQLVFCCPISFHGVVQRCSNTGS